MRQKGLLRVSRIDIQFTGLGEGVTFPAVMVILSKWTPPSERSRMTSFNFAGIMFGTVVSLAVTGALCEESAG